MAVASEGVRTRRGTRAGRVAAAVAWLLSAWWALYLPSAPLRVLPYVVALAWLGVGAWRGRRSQTAVLGVLGLLGALWFASTPLRSSGDRALPAVLSALVVVETVMAATIAVASAVALRSPSSDSRAGPIAIDLVPVTTLPSEFEAEVVAARLRSAGIRVAVFPSDAGGMAPHYAVGQGCRVVVLAGDLDRAREVLASDPGTASDA